jgi:hypothetical protein
LHSNQYKTDESVWESMREFLSLIPSQTSHYRSTETDKKYFNDTDLNVSKRYNSFKNWYYLQNKKQVIISLTLFSKHFNL